MAHTAQLLCSNVKTMFVSRHFGYVMGITTVAMALMKNFICAVRGREMDRMEVALSGKTLLFLTCTVLAILEGTCTILEDKTCDQY
jgi:hypothetical protein